MTQKNVAKHNSNCPKAFEAAVALANSSSLKVPEQKRKKDAEQTLYLTRI